MLPTHTVPDLRARELLTLVALAHYGSFVSAASQLKMSQPALTRTVKRVERLLGVTLFSRNTRRVEITTAGREFVAMSERVLSDLQLAVGSMKEVSAEQRGRVTVSTYSALAVRDLPSVVRRFQESRPSVEVRIREGRPQDVLEDVRSGIADFGFGIIDSLPDNLRTETLRREQVCVVVPTSHPFVLKKRTRLQVTDLQGEPLVSPPVESNLRRGLDARAAAAGLTLRYPVVVDHVLSMLVHVTSGNCIAVMPEGALPEQPWKDFDAIPLNEPSLSLSVGLITLAGRFQSPASQGLMTIMRDLAKHWHSVAS